ncbi:hypothetical protein C9J48_23965 [Photobacterium profundum]|uniref:Uncharacterized protein n=1 Tax=Photobacterium profundum 3TCK TaxID=314280 RepID=Q1Z9G2_9GAMM|nr:hypothetical protein [Photobacterium profundum]EAS44796.1 hypothetical protein P3TCK_19970 [Photobacterium profundum 3TCK]PSV59317.1 hypothetical protein C9J48_23965 [Photobacterium profundum]
MSENSDTLDSIDSMKEKDENTDTLNSIDSTKEKVSTEREIDRMLLNPSMFIIAFLFYGGLIWQFWLSDDDVYVDKLVTKINVTKMVENGADLESIKHFYGNLTGEEWGFIYRWDKDKANFYLIDTPLLTVLKDLKSDTYLDSNFSSKQRDGLNTIIAEYQQRNPFEGLEQAQKDSFENIRTKLANNFDDVSSDFYKISEDLKQKNLLVNQYLSDSKTSLYVSIASLAFAFITTFGSQYFYWRRKKNIKVEHEFS